MRACVNRKEKYLIAKRKVLAYKQINLVNAASAPRDLRRSISVFVALPIILVTLGIAPFPARATDYSVTVPFPVRTADWEDTAGLFIAPPQQSMTPDGTGHTEFYMAPVQGRSQVFITSIFEYSEAAPVGLRWKSTSTGSEIPLSEDLSEAVPGWSQRTMRLPASLAAQGGILIISGDQRVIARVRIDWLEPTETFVAVDQAIPGLIVGGRMIEAAMLSGRAELSPPDAWFGNVLEASLQEEPTSLDGGVVFEVPFEESLGTILFKAKFQGVMLGDGVEVWINDVLIGSIQPTAPPLTDPGYLRLADQRVIYAGWRDGAIFIPSGVLGAGDNTVVLRPATPGCSVRDAALQIMVPIEVDSTDPIDLGWPTN